MDTDWVLMRFLPSWSVAVSLSSVFCRCNLRKVSCCSTILDVPQRLLWSRLFIEVLSMVRQFADKYTRVLFFLLLFFCYYPHDCNYFGLVKIVDIPFVFWTYRWQSHYFSLVSWYQASLLFLTSDSASPRADS